MSATPADAQVIMQLFELRREAEMRKARDWFAAQFHPQSVDDIMSVLSQFGSDGNRFFRMVTSYWEMAATMANHGAVNEQLFLDTQNEMFFIFAKIHPYLDAFREKMGSPDAMRNVETLINKSETSRKKLEAFKKRIEQIRAMAMAAQKN
jgi:L-rhamnose mutarotase